VTGFLTAVAIAAAIVGAGAIVAFLFTR